MWGAWRVGHGGLSFIYCLTFILLYMNINILTQDECEILRSEIQSANNIVVCCHVNPDGDAIGSCLGWTEYLRSQGKQPRIIVPDQYPDFLRWMPNTERILRYDKHTAEGDELIAKADLIFLLDLNDMKRTDAMAPSLMKAKGKMIIIDHHLNPQAGCRLLISRPDMSSTCELVFRIVSQMGAFETMGRHFAVSVYCGMMTDTGGFTYNSTRPEIFYIISQLLTKGIDKDKIYRNVYNNYSENRLRLTGYVLYEKLQYVAACNATYFTLTRADQKRFHFIKGDAEGLVNMPLQIKGLKLSISLREDTEKDNVVLVSLRSVDDFPCNKMAEEFFNGGGHLNASGGKLYCSIEDAVEVAKRAIKTYESKLK